MGRAGVGGVFPALGARVRVNRSASFSHGALVHGDFSAAPPLVNTPHFLKKYRRMLLPDGLLHLKTDSKELSEYTLSILQNEKGMLLHSVEDLYDSEIQSIDLEIQTSSSLSVIEQSHSFVRVRVTGPRASLKKFMEISMFIAFRQAAPSTQTAKNADKFRSCSSQITSSSHKL